MRRFILLFIFFTGCQLGPKYEAPITPTSDHWKNTTELEKIPEVENWWDLFEDPDLSDLEAQVLEKNSSIYMAIQRVAEARATAGVAKSFLYPEANLKPSYNNMEALIELYGVPKGLVPGLKTITRVHELSYRLPVAMSYEVDLWGKFRGTYNAAKIYAEALEEALQSTILTLTADTASNYYNLRALDTQIALLNEAIAQQREKVAITQNRFDKGLISKIDLYNEEATLSTRMSELADSIYERQTFENAIAVLVGLNATEFTVEAKELAKKPPDVPPGLSSNLLMRRPDVAQAERAMASVHALIGVAYATYFPSLNLTSTLGFVSPELSKFLTWASRLWQIGANMSQVLFNGGRNASYVNLAMAKFEEMKGSYQNTVLNAFSEVEDALSDVKEQSKQTEDLQDAFNAKKNLSCLSEKRYEKGLVNKIDVIDAKINAIDAEKNFINSLGQEYQAKISLIKAIGGRWVPPCCCD